MTVLRIRKYLIKRYTIRPLQTFTMVSRFTPKYYINMYTAVVATVE